jgi:hypothetical protein
MLAGTLEKPSRSGRFAVAVIIAGTGQWCAAAGSISAPACTEAALQR